MIGSQRKWIPFKFHSFASWLANRKVIGLFLNSEMSNLSPITLNPFAVFDIDGCHLILSYHGFLALGKPIRIKGQFVLPERSYILVLRTHYEKWVEKLVFCTEVLIGGKKTDPQSLIIQDSKGLKIACSIEEDCITLITNQGNSGVNLDLKEEVLLRLLEGLSSFLLFPLCSTPYLAARISTFLNFYSKKIFDLNEFQLVWQALEKVYNDEPESFISEMSIFIKINQKEISEASKALFFFNLYKSFLIMT